MGIRLDDTQHPQEREGRGRPNQQAQPKIPFPDTPLLLPLHRSWGCPSPPRGTHSIPGALQRSLAASRSVGTLSSACHAPGTWTFGSCLPGRCLERCGNMSQSSLLSLTSPSCSFIQHVKYLPCAGPRYPGEFFFSLLLTVTASKKPPQCHLGKLDLAAKQFQHPFPCLFRRPAPLQAAIPSVRDGEAGCQNPQAKATTHRAAAGKGHFRPTSSTA